MHQLSRRTLLKTGLGAAAAAGAASVAGAGLRLPYAVRTARGADLPTGQDLKFWWWGEQEAPGLEGWLKQSVEAWQAATGNTLETTLLDTGVVISEFQNASAAMAAPDIQFFWNGIYHMESVWLGYVEPLNGLIADDLLAASNATSLSVYEGKQYRTGWYSVPLLWVYNKEIGRAHV